MGELRMEESAENTVNEFWNTAVQYAKRREFLGKFMPLCPECRTEQVQLVAYIDVAAQWKCRICKHRFEYEPNEDNK